MLITAKLINHIIMQWNNNCVTAHTWSRGRAGSIIKHGGSSPNLFCKTRCRFPRSFLHTFIYCSKKSFFCLGREDLIYPMNIMFMDNIIILKFCRQVFNSWNDSSIWYILVFSRPGSLCNGVRVQFLSRHCAATNIYNTTNTSMLKIIILLQFCGRLY